MQRRLPPVHALTWQAEPPNQGVPRRETGNKFFRIFRFLLLRFQTAGRDAMSDQQPRTFWRIRAGFAFFVASIGWPVLIPILPLLGASPTVTAAFSGVMVVAAEFMLLAGAAIAGNEGFAFIKAKVFGFFKSYGPRREVSRVRYIIGLVMFATPLAFGWLSPYIELHLPGFTDNRLVYAIPLDVLLLISLFVLGGAFWDKLRSLFSHDAYAVLPSKERRGDG